MQDGSGHLSEILEIPAPAKPFRFLDAAKPYGLYVVLTLVLVASIAFTVNHLMTTSTTCLLQAQFCAQPVPAVQPVSRVRGTQGQYSTPPTVAATITSTTTSKYWFHPNYMPLWFPHNYADASWGSYFTDPHVMDNTLSQAGVMQFWPEAIVLSDSQQWFEHLLPDLQAHHTQIAINAGYVGTFNQYSANSCSGTATANYDITAYLKPIYAKGATVTYLVMDGFPISLLQAPCNDSVAQALPELVTYMQTIHKSYPAIQIGLDVNFPNWAYDGTPSYWGTTAPLSDYKPIFDQMVKETRAANEQIAFLQADNPYDYAVGIHSSSYSNVHTVDWTARILQLEKQAQSYAIPFGLIVNSDFPTTSPQGNANDDALFYYNAMNYLRYYQQRGGNPDQIIASSWYPYHPTALLPSTTPFTFTNFFASVESGRPFDTLTVPVYELKNASGYAFYTIIAAEKNNAITQYGFTLQKISFYADASGVSGTVPVLRLTNYKNDSRLYTIYPSEAASAEELGYQQEGTAFYAFANAAAGRTAVYRLHLPTQGFYYTIDPKERDALVAAGAKSNGIAFYVPAGP